MIRVRLLVSFVLVALLPVIGVGVGAYFVSYDYGRQQSIDRLESVAARKEMAIEGWMLAIQQELLFASQSQSSPTLINSALRLGNEGADYAWYNNLVRKQLKSYLDQSTQLEELFLVDLQGDVVVSTGLEREKKIYTSQAFYRHGLNRPAAQLPFYDQAEFDEGQFLLQQDSASVIAAVPVYGEGSKLLGVLGGRAGIEELHKILGERTGLGKSGVAYLVNMNRALLAGSQLPAGAGEGAPAIAVQAPGIEGAILNRMNSSGETSGYHGQAVIGVYRLLPEMEVILAVEQDREEAYQAVSTTTLLILVIAFGALAAAIAASLYVTRSIADPIINLANTAAQIADGNLDKAAQVEREDEVGALARAFNSMTAQLRDLISSLEQRVQSRTLDLIEANAALNQRAIQLETSAKVGREITSILELDVMLNRVAELIQDAFGYYHVQIFLLNKDERRLELATSSGKRLTQFKEINLDAASINARAARTGEIELVNDVSGCPDFLFDEDLPETRSELVIPLQLGEQIIGTLDVQHNIPDAFGEEEKLVLQSLGDQIVVAIENAKLYDQSRDLAVLEERTRLARELHDSVTQSLYSLALLTEGWRRMLPNASEAQIEEYLGRIGEISQQSLKEMRLLIHELRPPTLEQEGLVGALRKRLDAVEKRVGIEARVLMDELIEMPPNIEEELYRIAQEALNNSLRHSGAKKEIVHLCVQDNQIVVEISDDGIGFDLQAAEAAGGMGLAIMRERARQLGGTLIIQSRPGDGTTVIISVPKPGTN